MIVNNLSPRDNKCLKICGLMEYVIIPQKLLVDNIKYKKFLQMFKLNYKMYLSTSLYKYYDFKSRINTYRYRDGKVLSRCIPQTYNFTYGFYVEVNVASVLDDLEEHLEHLHNHVSNINIRHSYYFIKDLCAKERVYFVFHKQDYLNHYKMYVCY